MKDTICHSGVIEKISDHTVFVKIIQQSACAGCHAKSMCMAADSKDKIIEIPDTTGSFHVNEQVVISGQSSMGLQAVFLAFVLPLFLIIFGIALTVNIYQSELIGALTGLSILLFYYGVLYITRDKLKKKFIFTLKKQKTNLSIA
ncbi:positive regulator of sigma E activity [Parabacteroides sp. PF5-5]|uniref:SoxR reducing system RseC family protein n=1 Tax=unclassified Parabacteroides TaxID=2649774 RepID=UPI00247380B7|nr:MULTISPECIES: SoxR reducing system RseC family protein [unclassified Parabacteroides]MDH6304564.1 positive regulator of sigma E activity [Parabacteroides sp. PH5-39]MDH6315823.1 positive regulator of sigma E activity [Parabacteroides sp. PF5-13]MDH6319482.1 positive regulator of sigma E activity [Parabacteroides sp. PH5-13]MDH6323213.1 positive regulator of sigma E activity [Parabacteroides sp. PH5-8]MDH6327015.1 positive regulator of sigma E activity [Parabacteroides sp. PH5-41]